MWSSLVTYNMKIHFVYFGETEGEKWEERVKKRA